MTAITETVVTAEFTPCTFAGPRTWEVEKINIHFLLCASRDGQVLCISLFNLLQVSERDGGYLTFPGSRLLICSMETVLLASLGGCR